jgi:hypothetical protein
MNDEQSTDDIDCLYCMDQGTVKRRYGTVGPGPAKRVKTIDCPVCAGGEGDGA